MLSLWLWCCLASRLVRAVRSPVCMIFFSCSPFFFHGLVTSSNVQGFAFLSDRGTDLIKIFGLKTLVLCLIPNMEEAMTLCFCSPFAPFCQSPPLSGVDAS